MKESAKSVFLSVRNEMFEDEHLEPSFDNEETLKEMLSFVRMWWEQYGKLKTESERDHNYVLREFGLKLATLKPDGHKTEKTKRKMNLSKAERARRSKRMKKYWLDKRAGEKTPDINATIGNPVPDLDTELKTTPKKEIYRKKVTSRPSAVYEYEDIGDGIQRVRLPDGDIRYRYAGDSAEMWLTEKEARESQITLSSRPTKNE